MILCSSASEILFYTVSSLKKFMEEALFNLINNLAGQNQMVDTLGLFLAEYLIFVLIGLVVILWLWKSLRNHAYLAGVSLLVSRSVVEVPKLLFDRPRPFASMEVNQLIEHETGSSFPSGHTVVLFAIAFSFYGTRWFWPFIVLATLGSLARVFVGVHYVSDVLTSVVIAALVVWGISILFKKRFLM
jgi:undecaprenyl-diphosphatase